MTSFPIPPESYDDLVIFLQKYPESALGYFFGMVYVVMPEKKLETFSLSSEGVEYFKKYIQILKNEFLNLKTFLYIEPQNFFKILESVEEMLELRNIQIYGMDDQKISSKIEVLEHKILCLISNDVECSFLYSYFSIIHEEGQIQ